MDTQGARGLAVGIILAFTLIVIIMICGFTGIKFPTLNFSAMP